MAIERINKQLIKNILSHVFIEEQQWYVKGWGDKSLLICLFIYKIKYCTHYKCLDESDNGKV